MGTVSHYVVSICELGVGGEANLYVTSLVGEKPFTFGPYPSQAKQVNHALIVGDILMLVDNDDDPFLRAGGIYLYHLNFNIDNPDFISFLDYIDYQDLQIEGFTGMAYIGSADLHRPFSSSQHEYRLFITDARSGSIFVFGFQVSNDGREVVYLSQNYISLDKFLTPDLAAPTRPRVNAIRVLYYF